ncbi:HD domain-containing protein [Haloechinothrix salitolerans]|uniref:HD domain-containing protein n=1 Tax=Haloechinothrix salitolerans TaxID=926830 RepID=A0ABW2BXV0_9PSEU
MVADVTALLAESARVAEHFVAPLGQRWTHVQSVARAAEALSVTVDGADASLLVAAAWLHDIGYAPALAATRFHPLDGARYLRDEGWPERVVNLVAHHSGARFEAAERGLEAELSAFPLEDSPVMDALLMADLTTGPDGSKLRYRERIAEILSRYPADHPVHRAWLKAADPLEASIERVKHRLKDRLLSEEGL